MILFIIVYGSYGITYSKGSGGEFHCPTCSAPRAYRHRRVRRFFHVFFIPLIPLNLAGEYVECGQCRGTYKLGVLETSKALGAAGQAPVAPAISEGQRGVRRVLAMMTLADGRVEEAEIAAIVEFLSYAERRAVTREEVLAELEATRREPADVEAYCRTLMGFLNEQGRHDVLKAAQLVASADGHVDPNEQRLLERIGVALGMRPAQVSTNLAAAPPRPSAPFCGQCGAPGRWIAEHQCWGCDHCRAVIPL
ncbi:MAG: TerB family tellurite resistance protein [Myxococcales bacterium]|nr:TerB family tellurite resistance protein [Myxococcales bacterium]